MVAPGHREHDIICHLLTACGTCKSDVALQKLVKAWPHLSSQVRDAITLIAESGLQS